MMRQLVLVMLIVVGACIPGCGAKPDANARANMATAKKIVAAIDQYYADVGAYPPSLNALVPKYISQIPQPQGNVQWDYRLEDSGRVYLFGYAGTHPELSGWYASNHKTWNTAD
jgi:hypothetical protein